jgi:restriction endonuclease S subunit
MITARAKAAWFTETGVRLDASYHLSEGRQAEYKIKQSPNGWKELGDVTKRIFNGGRPKRYYVDDVERGIPFMGNADMLKADFTSLKLISKTKTANLSDLWFEKGWTLLSRSGTYGGTLGKAVYATNDFVGKTGSEHIMRVVPDEDKIPGGYLYAFLASKYGYGLLTQNTYGSAIQHIEQHHVLDLPVPLLPESEVKQVHEWIEQSAGFREEATCLMRKAGEELMLACGLSELTANEYEYFGFHPASRPVSTFISRKVDATTLTAFNYSKRISQLRARVIENVNTLPLADCLEGNRFFSTGSFKRLELDSPTSIELINQSDIFDIRIKGKRLARKYAGTQRLVDYGEVLIAGVGTLGENEIFCRALFAGEELRGKLISGEFIRMNTNGTIPPGYLYAWLASEYGFRLIRATQAGTKLCRPIPKLLADVPVPVLSTEKMDEIHQLIVTAHAKRHEALQLENQAIQHIEAAISSW